MDEFDPKNNPPLQAPNGPDGSPCPACGYVLPRDARFCPECGCKIPATAALFDFSNLPEWWKWAAGVLAILAVLGVLVSRISSLFQGNDSAPEAAAEQASVETAASSATESAARTSRTRRPRAAKPQRPAEPPPPEGSWKVHTEVSPLDDTKAVYLDLKAEEPFPAWGAGSFTPTLSVSCRENKIQAYIAVGEPPAREGHRDYATVHLRFDKLDSKRTRLLRSVDGDALFFQDAVQMVESMVAHDELVFGFTPRNSDLVLTTFALSGLQHALPPLVEECDNARLRAALPIEQSEEEPVDAAAQS